MQSRTIQPLQRCANHQPPSSRWSLTPPHWSPLDVFAVRIWKLLGGSTCTNDILRLRDMRGDVFKALPLEETSGNIRNLARKESIAPQSILDSTTLKGTLRSLRDAKRSTIGSVISFWISHQNGIRNGNLISHQIEEDYCTSSVSPLFAKFLA